MAFISRDIYRRLAELLNNLFRALLVPQVHPPNTHQIDIMCFLLLFHSFASSRYKSKSIRVLNTLKSIDCACLADVSNSGELSADSSVSREFVLWAPSKNVLPTGTNVTSTCHTLKPPPNTGSPRHFLRLLHIRQLIPVSARAGNLWRNIYTPRYYSYSY